MDWFLWDREGRWSGSGGTERVYSCVTSGEHLATVVSLLEPTVTLKLDQECCKIKKKKNPQIIIISYILRKLQ